MDFKIKQMKVDLISLVANAVATSTEEEAIEYLNDVHFDSIEEAQQIVHTIDVLNQIKTNTQQQYEDSSQLFNIQSRTEISIRKFPC